MVSRCCFLVVAFVAFATSASAAPPNIVFIIGDDQAYGDYGFMGHPQIHTPHLDALAKQSLVFKRGYVPTSLCRASLATMITGLYPHQHKITSNDPPIPAGLKPGQANKDPGYLKLREQMVNIFEQSPNLAKLVEKQGYVSQQSGKWWEGNACRCGGFSEGMTIGDPTKGGRHGDEGLKIGRTGLEPVFKFMDQAKKDNKPFFVWYAPMMPHQPHNPPERLMKKYEGKHKSRFVAKYWAMCEWFDETIGDVLKHLDESKLAENTIVVYLHDNGWIQDETKEGFAAGSKRSPNEGGVRTPILIRWPGKVKPGTNDALASSIDLVPTMLHAIGGKPTADMLGINLLDEAATKKRTTVYGEIFEHNAINITKPAANEMYRWIIDGHMKLIVPNTKRVPKDVVELYDLAKDPNEAMNLAAKQPEQVKKLMEKLNAWWPAKE